MAEDFGNGVSLTLSAEDAQYTGVVWQENKPPMDSELNLMHQLSEEARQKLLQAGMPSGWVSNPYNPKFDYECSLQASNMFWLGHNQKGAIPKALVNGWVIPIAGTLSSDFRSAIKLPPPSTVPAEGDINFVFLEVWKAQIAPEGTVNKPAADQIYRYGNVEYGGTNITHQIQHPTLNIETTERVQIQYRIRVVQNVNPAIYPFGFNPAVRSQGPLSAPTTSASSLYQYTNMKNELGDPGLWRAGDGNGSSGILQTVDGYVYAIPICLVFRRTDGGWDIGNQMHQAAFNRNPNMTDRTQASVFPEVKLTTDITRSSTTILVDTSQASTTFSDTGGLIRIGEELIEYSAWTGQSITVSTRGAKGSQASAHYTDEIVGHVTGHPEGLFSDQIMIGDILDLRHVVNFDGMDHYALLQHNFNKLAKGELETTWKRSEAAMRGTKLFQVDYLSQTAAPPNGTLEGDAPDGFRKIFSDAAALQPNNLITFGLGQATATADFTSNITGEVKRTAANVWSRGDILRIPLDQLRNTFKTTNRQKVRFVHPDEYSDVIQDHSPIKIWFGETNPNRVFDELLNFGKIPYAPISITGAPTTVPIFVVLGEKPSGLSVPTEDLGGILDFSGDTIVVQGVDFSSNAASLAGAWIVVGDDNATATNPLNHGAFRILGTDGGTGLQVQNHDGTATTFTTATDTRDWYIRLESCTVEDDELFVVLTWDRGSAFASATNLWLTFDVLYHPASGLGRNPHDSLFVRVETPDPTQTGYVREPNFANRVTSASATVRDVPVVPMSAYPHDRDIFITRSSQTLLRGNETAWSEAYVDKGSKTLLFQPLKQIQAKIDPLPLDIAPSWAGTINIPNFELDPGDAVYQIPTELVPSYGRIDVPFVDSRNTDPTSVPFGLNFMFLTSGGENAASSLPNTRITLPRILLIYDPSSAISFGSYVPLSSFGGNTLPQEALVCQAYEEQGIRGIELPAHYGISRLYGVYKASDFYSNGGAGAFLAPTFRDDTGSTIENLIRRDAGKRNLVVSRTSQGEERFIIPEDVIDIQTLNAAVSDSALIFEVSLFLFDNWEGTTGYTEIYTTNATGSLTSDLSLFANGAAASIDQLYTVSTRIPYQGSIYGTMPTATADTSNVDLVDYIPKRELENQTEVEALLRNPLDVDDARISNPASLEVLASLPFVTTMGTGVISGLHRVGSYTDVGCMSLNNYPYPQLTTENRTLLSRALPSAQGVTNLTPPASEYLTGLTERLPCGILAGDYAFVGEGLQGGAFKRFFEVTAHAGQHDDHFRNLLTSKATNEGLIVFSDGTSIGSDALVGYDSSYNLYRTYRGGTAYTGSGDKPGGAITYTTERIYKDLPYIGTPRTEDLQIRGAVMFGVALLVRNDAETVTDNNYEVSYGSELQMLIITGLSFGLALDLLSGPITKEIMDLLIQLHPTGIGEGFCAADRYRIDGRPLQRGAFELPQPDATKRDLNGPNPPQNPNPCVCP